MSMAKLTGHEDYEELNNEPAFSALVKEWRAYREAERDGWCVILPCKVGTRVWVVGQNCDLCKDMYSEEPCLFGECEYKGVFESVFTYSMIDGFGKTVFLTHPEADAALKGAGK